MQHHNGDNGALLVPTDDDAYFFGVRHPFVFHESCWSLLQAAYSGEPVPLTRFHEVCSSLLFPYDQTSLVWGHDYGGLLRVDDQLYPPWENQSLRNNTGSVEWACAEHDPYDSSTVQRLLKQGFPHVPRCYITGELDGYHPTRVPNGGNDCFLRLPWEVMEEIAAHLPTADALGLRLLSRAFTPIFSSKVFWASRFEASTDERGYLFEARHGQLMSLDCRSVYNYTNKMNSPPGLRNRERIWRLILSLKDILSLHWEEAESPKLIDRSNQGGDLIWRDVCGDRFHVRATDQVSGFHRLHNGGRLLRKQCAFIPDQLSRIGVTVIRDGDVECIAGITLRTREGEDVCFGYRAKGKERFVDVPAFRGFAVAIGFTAIHALQVIFDREHSSQWFGCPDRWPKTHRLIAIESIAALEVVFDVRFPLFYGCFHP